MKKNMNKNTKLALLTSRGIELVNKPYINARNAKEETAKMPSTTGDIRARKVLYIDTL